MILNLPNGNKATIAAKKGTVRQTNRHYLSDAITPTSLLWAYSNGDCLTISTPICYSEPKLLETVRVHTRQENIFENPYGVVLSLYNEKACDAKLSIELGTAKGTCQAMEYYLNFKGWKTLQIPYDRGILNGFPTSDMDTMRFVVASSKKGELFIDEINFGVSLFAANVALQMFAQSPKMHSPITRRMTVKNPQGRLPRPLMPLEKSLTQQQLDDFSKIESRYLELLEEGDTPVQASFETTDSEIDEFYKSYGLIVSNGQITGKKIQDSNHYCAMLKRIAGHYLKNKDEILFEKYLNLLWHLDDQNTAINWYNGRGTASSLLMLKAKLINDSHLDYACQFIKEKYYFHRLYATSGTADFELHGYRFEDTDDIGLCLPSWLVCVLLQENTPKKLSDMQYFLNYLENFVLGNAPGLESGFKPDGTSHHHGGFILGYENVALVSISRIFYMLSGSGFMVSKKAVDKFRYILQTQYSLLNGIYEPFATKQYRFNPKEAVPIRSFAYYADGANDTEMAGKYMSLAACSEKEKACEWYGRFVKKGIIPHKTEDLHKTLTYAATGLHKREHFAQAVRGCSKYVFGQEIWSKEGGRYTAFGYFRAFGFLEQLYEPTEETGTNNGLLIENGFDFTRWPGTTTVKYPLELFCSQPLKVDDEYAEWLLTGNGFVGGLDYDKNGIFALGLHGHEKYGLESFRANKSYHFHDDVTICLGSGITNSITGFYTQTTLFQDVGNFVKVQSDYYLDSHDVAYRLLDGKFPVLENGTINSRDIYDLTDTTGERTTLYINHGYSPKSEGYAYLVKQGATENSLAELSQKLESEKIQIVRLDETAHIVRLENTLNMVLFLRDYNLNCGIVEAVTESCIISVTEHSNSSFTLCVSDPDLRFYHGDSEDYDINHHMGEKAIYARGWANGESIASTIHILLKCESTGLETVKGNFKILWTKGGKMLLETVCKDGLTNECNIIKQIVRSE